VGDDELPLGGGEVAVGDVDRDALLALGPQPVGEQRQVGVGVAPLQAGALDRLELVLEDRLRVEEQPADQRGLPVVARPRGREPEELHGLSTALSLAAATPGTTSRAVPGPAWRRRRF